MTKVKSVIDEPRLQPASQEVFSRILTDDLLEKVVRPGQYLGNEWGAYRRPWHSASVHLSFVFPDLYELGMSNFGQRILYQIVNEHKDFLADRSYAPAGDMEALLRQRGLPMWAFESRMPLKNFELLGFSLAYELTYTNVLNLLDLAQIPVLSAERKEIFPLIFGGGPSTVNPEPMAMFMDFFIIGDGEKAIPQAMEVIAKFKMHHGIESNCTSSQLREELLFELASKVEGIYAPSLYGPVAESPVVKPLADGLPERIARQVIPLTDSNQPTAGLVSYLNLIHDRQVLEVRRGCDRGCRFCQPGYTFLPVRERSTEDLLRLSKEGLEKSGHQEYSMLSLCVSDYTSLQDSVRALNLEHASRRASMSFPSQRADRMNLDLAEELKVVRKSGITLAPEAGSERLRAVINKGLNHKQIIDAIESAYRGGWNSVKLYFMLGLPTETDEDIAGIIEILKEANAVCKQVRRSDPARYRRQIEFTLTLSNTVPKPFTPFQWYGQIDTQETLRRQRVLKDKLKESKLAHVTMNFTAPAISMLEAVISRGDRKVGEIIYRAWKKGATFDAWDERFKLDLWNEAAAEVGESLAAMATTARTVGSKQPWDIVHVGLADWWLVKEWEKAMSVQETAPCTENTCHACGVCTELDTTHLLAAPKSGQTKRNPFVKELAAHKQEDSHPSLFFMEKSEPPSNKVATTLRFTVTKTGDLRFISHLDFQHLLARAARRAQINLAYTEGFNPQPKISLSVSLPLFQESTGEIGQVELAEEIGAAEFQTRINAQLPVEVQMVQVKDVKGQKASLASLVGRATYIARPVSINADGSLLAPTKLVLERMEERVTSILLQSTLELVKPAKVNVPSGTPSPAVLENSSGDSEKTVRDIRSGIYSLKIGQGHEWNLEMELKTGSVMHIKPSDILNLIDSEVIWRVTRNGLTTPEGVSLFDLP